jgi:dienelactone hydrolase
MRGICFVRFSRRRWVAAACALSLAVVAGSITQPLPSSGSEAPPPGTERVSFQSPNPELKEPVPAFLLRPAGNGPFPAIVLVHPCGGIHKNEYEWAAWLQTQGYMTLLIDSLAAWHQTSVCYAGAHGAPGPIHPTPHDSALDAFGGLRYLRSRSDVNPDRTALIGWSFGGNVALFVTNARVIHQARRDGIAPFQAAVGLYPGCAFGSGSGPRLGTPLLLLLGGADEWAPPASCVQWGTNLQAAGAPIEWTVYPGATHEFDVLGLNGTVKVSGKVIPVRYDERATADAHTRIQGFLAAHLK